MHGRYSSKKLAKKRGRLETRACREPLRAESPHTHILRAPHSFIRSPCS